MTNANGFGKKKREPEGKSARKDGVLKTSAFVRKDACRTSKENANGKRGTSDAGEKIATGETEITMIVAPETVTAIMIVPQLTALIVAYLRDIVTRR